MRERHERLTIATALVILLITALLHVVVGVLVEGVLHLGWGDRPLPTTDEVMEVALVPDETTPPEETEREARDKLDRVVQNDRIVEERAPDETDKISEFDNRTAQESTAPLARRQAGQAARRASPNKNPSPATADSNQPPSVGSSVGAADQPMADDASAIENLRQDDAGELSSQSSAAPPARSPGLSGMRETIRETFGQRGSLDHFEDIDEGAETILNTRRNRFASFFNRVRDAIAQHWHPEVIHAARDPYGKVYGNKTRVTRLHIVLAPDGSVRKIGIEDPAGINYLDEEAIRAVRAAQPFTNPPAQLIDPKTNTIEFSFSFILLLDGSKRIFRYSR